MLMPRDELERRLIDARDSFDARIEALEADIRRRLPRPGDDRPARLERLIEARERCERMILAGYPEG